MATAGQKPMAVIGAGSWGTALAIQLARAGNDTCLWGRDAAQRDAMRRSRCNERYLPDAAFPDSLSIASDLGEAAGGSPDVLVAVPSHAFRETLEAIRPLLRDSTRIAWATKGFETATASCRTRSRPKSWAAGRAQCCQAPRSRRKRLPDCRRR